MLGVVALLHAVSIHLVLRLLLLLEILLHHFLVLLPDLASGGVFAIGGIVDLRKSGRVEAGAARGQAENGGKSSHRNRSDLRFYRKNPGIQTLFGNYPRPPEL